MRKPEASPLLVKAAMLFVDRIPGRPWLAVPWAFRCGRENIVWASDAHTMFIARDPAGRHFSVKPVPITNETVIKPSMPTWRPALRGVTAGRLADKPVDVDPKLHARVMRAARILGIKSVGLSVSNRFRSDPIVYTLGPDAWACVMPKYDVERPAVPDWLRKVLA